MTEKTFLYKDLTYAIIGTAMEVHRVLGPGFLESVYEEALAHEFDPSTSSGHRLRGIPYLRQAQLDVRYKTITADYPSTSDWRSLLRTCLVDEKVVVEIKATKALTDGDAAQLHNYAKETSYHVGLLINFGAPSLEHTRRAF